MNKVSFIANELDRRPAFLIFVIIFSLTALNAIFNSIAFSLGYEFPYATFLFNPNDRFADYFKMVFSYPGAADLQIAGASRFSMLLSDYLYNNPYKGLAGLARGELTNFHLTPLTTIISLLNLKFMHYLNPVMIFVAILLLGLTVVYKFIVNISGSKLDLVFLLLSLLFCYPILFMVTRGNVFSGITFMSLLAFLVFMYQDKKRYLALILLAIAVNIRPNSIVFIFALGLCESKNLKKDIPLFLGMVASFFIASLFFSNLMYADYNIDNILSGLRIYHAQYVIGNGGLAFGSSLFSPLKAVLGYSKLIETVPIVIAGLFVVISALQLRANKISKIAFVFILCTSYVLGSAVIADYHLAVFFAPLLCMYLERGKGYFNSTSPALTKELLIVFFSSVFVLCPKNYLYIGSISGQVALNPIVLLLASIFIVLAGGMKSRGERLAGRPCNCEKI